MANKSPAELKREGAELKVLLAKIKKKQHNCALLMAKEGLVFEVHLKKSPEMLLKAAKKAGGMPKGAWGTITMEGQVLTLDPVNDKIPGNLTKLAKKYFAERGLKNRLEIKEPEAGDPQNAPAPEAQPREKADVGPSTPDSGSKGPDLATDLRNQLKALRPRIGALLADKENLMVDGLKDMMGLFTRAMKDNLFDHATEALAKVTSVLDDYDAQQARKKPFLDRMSALSRGLEKVVNGPDEDAATTIARYKRAFEYALENNEWFSAGEKLDQIEALIEAHKNTTPPRGQESPAPHTPAPDPKDDQRVALLQAFKALMPQIKATQNSENKTLSKNVSALAKGFAAAMKGGDLEKSKKILDVLGPMVAPASDSGRQEQENRLSQLRQMRAALNAMLKELQQ